jgi:hypothetical protein
VEGGEDMLLNEAQHKTNPNTTAQTKEQTYRNSSGFCCFLLQRPPFSLLPKDLIDVK